MPDGVGEGAGVGAVEPVGVAEGSPVVSVPALVPEGVALGMACVEVEGVGVGSVLTEAEPELKLPPLPEPEVPEAAGDEIVMLAETEVFRLFAESFT